jgi:hypothetical protein
LQSCGCRSRHSLLQMLLLLLQQLPVRTTVAAAKATSSRALCQLLLARLLLPLMLLPPEPCCCLRLRDSLLSAFVTSRPLITCKRWACHIRQGWQLLLVRLQPQWCACEVIGVCGSALCVWILTQRCDATCALHQHAVATSPAQVDVHRLPGQRSARTRIIFMTPVI